MLDLQHSVDVFEVYILVAVWNVYALTFTSKLFLFICCYPTLILYLSHPTEHAALTFHSGQFLYTSVAYISSCYKYGLWYWHHQNYSIKYKDRPWSTSSTLHLKECYNFIFSPNSNMLCWMYFFIVLVVSPVLTCSRL